MKYIPAALVLLRFFIGPLMLWDAIAHHISPLFIICFVIAFLSDIFDGIIARRLGVSTANLRQADGWADTCLYICVAASAWIIYPKIIIDFKLGLLFLLSFHAVWWVVNLIKYGKPASYHTYSAKLWGITLFIATVALFGFGYAGITLWLAIGVGIIHSSEEILITFLLPYWTHDVLSIVHALNIKMEESNTNPVSLNPK
jgi:phosphatidylglycerophosphate synthase